MNTEKYYVALSGRPLFGYRQDEAAAALGQLLNMPEAMALDMLKGKPWRIKKALDKNKALRLKEKIIACGATCDIEPVNKPGERPPAGVTRSSADALAPRGVSQSGHSGENPPQQAATPENLSLEGVAPQQQAGPERLSLDDLTPEQTSSEGLTLDEVVPEQAEPEQLSPIETTSVGQEHLQPLLDGDESQETPPQPVADQEADDENLARFYEQPVRFNQGRNDDRESVTPARPRLRKPLLIALTAVFLLVGGWLAFSFMDTGVGSGRQVQEEVSVTSEQASRPSDPKLEKTYQRMDMLVRSVRIWMIQFGSGFDPSQVTMERMQQDLQISAADMTDGWRTPFRYHADNDRYILVSAGPDRAFATGDDLTRKKSAR